MSDMALGSQSITFLVKQLNSQIDKEKEYFEKVLELKNKEKEFDAYLQFKE